MRGGGRRGGGKLKGLCGQLTGSPICRGLKPAIFRLRGKGVSITLARMDQFIYNLGVVLSDSAGATGLPRKSSWRWRLESSVRAYGELDTANPVHGRTTAKRPSVAGSENCVEGYVTE